MPDTFTLSIKPYGEAPAYQHGFHLGTTERVARDMAESIFSAKVNNGEALESVALMRGGAVFDTFDGSAWNSDLTDLLYYLGE